MMITLLTAVSFTPASGTLTTLDVYLFVSCFFSFVGLILISIITTTRVRNSSSNSHKSNENNLNAIDVDGRSGGGDDDEMNYTGRGKTLNQVGKFILPLLFLIFNAFYWLVSVIFPAAMLN